MLPSVQAISCRKPSMLLFMALLVVPCIAIPLGQQLALTHNNIRVWHWVNFLWLLPAIPFVWWQSAAGLPNLWQPDISNRLRIALPLLAGTVFGLLDVLIIKFILHPEPYTDLPPFLQPFPYSIFLYSSGALEIEIWYRLIPITLMMLAVQRWVPVKHHGKAFLAIAIITALREPIEQWPSGAWWFVAYAFVSGFAMNFLQAVFLGRAGFIASLMVRLGHYLWWHILLGVYVQAVELV